MKKNVFVVSAIFIFLYQSSIYAHSEDKCSLNPHNLVFSFAQEGEIKKLVNFAVKSNDVYQTRTAPREVAVDVFSISKAQIKNKLVEKLWAKDCQKILGFYSLKDHGDPNEIELGHLFVRPGYFRKGLGRTLFHRALDRAQNMKFKTLTWISDPDAEKFYFKMGATKTGVDENLLNPSVPVPLFSIQVTNN